MPEFGHGLNVDETGISVLQSKVLRVVGLKGKRQVGALNAAERRSIVTVVCSMIAGGIFPCDRNGFNEVGFAPFEAEVVKTVILQASKGRRKTQKQPTTTYPTGMAAAADTSSSSSLNKPYSGGSVLPEDIWPIARSKQEGKILLPKGAGKNTQQSCRMKLIATAKESNIEAASSDVDSGESVFDVSIGVVSQEYEDAVFQFCEGMFPEDGSCELWDHYLRVK
ncbi:hypothetical protein PR048_004651 [Dryococelus australis]|uniref:Uncharacterized protein n=1 Tax=Dryococelus australis TaxID=614101 RepID=A0ABQ9I742_9NEOP|nr:hypothetical protein PR048_004651 [Dryococelus australis]